MTLDIVYTRLHNQHLTEQLFDKPVDVVSWFGAMQSQDFAAAKWAIALRAKNQTDASIETAFNEGEILRTHVMRPTWHFVAPSDIRWLLELTSPHVHRFNGYYYRRSGFDKLIFKKSNEVIRKALLGGKQLTRTELETILQKADIPTKDLSLTYCMMQAELDGIVVSGPRRDKKFTYMLLDERVPQTKTLTRNEALAELTKRYFQSHGPAQIKDFSWWSGLNLTDTKKGIELVKTKLIREEINGKTYWFYPLIKQINSAANKTFLVPGFDEYFIAYSDRGDILDKQYVKQLNQGGGMINGAVVINGKMVGGWKRTFEKKHVVVTIKLFEKISEAQQQSLQQQAEQYGKFLNLPVVSQQV